MRLKDKTTLQVWHYRSIYGAMFMSLLWYLTQPLIIGNRSIPTAMSWREHTTQNVPLHYYLLLYLGHIMIGSISVCLFAGYDSVYYLIINVICTRIRTVCHILDTLQYTGTRDHERDRRILVDCYLLHLDLLE